MADDDSSKKGMSPQTKVILTAVGVGAGATVAANFAGETAWMKSHPELWYLDAVACGGVAYLARKKNAGAAIGLAVAGAILALQGYQHRNDVAPDAADAAPTAAGPALPAPAATAPKGAVNLPPGGTAPPFLPGGAADSLAQGASSAEQAGSAPANGAASGGGFDPLGAIAGFFAPVNDAGIVQPSAIQRRWRLR